VSHHGKRIQENGTLLTTTGASELKERVSHIRGARRTKLGIFLFICHDVGENLVRQAAFCLPRGMREVLRNQSDADSPVIKLTLQVCDHTRSEKKWQ